MTDEERKHWRGRYKDQKNNAKRRSIRFLLTFEEWLAIWIASGHLHERGRKRGQYCMSRFNDKGAYRVGNVEIILSGVNVAPNIIKLNHSRTGVPLVQSHKDAIRDKSKGRGKGTIIPHLVESNKARKGVWRNPKRAELNRAAFTGVPKPQAQREAMSAARRRWWAARRAKIISQDT